MCKNNKIAAIVLAAGKGTRMNSRNVNKVALPLAKKPMIAYTLDLLRQLKIEKIVIVVGFAHKSIKKFLGPNFIYAHQRKRLGTAHATKCGLKSVPSNADDILVLNGDDSAFYRPEVIRKLVAEHKEKKADLTLLTIEAENPNSLGRILRDSGGKIIGIMEDKDATLEQKKIKEINPACYVFKRKFLEKFLPRVSKSRASGEYYLTDLIRLGVENKKKVSSLKVKNIFWRGVNTWEELKEAEAMMRRIQNVN